MRYSVAKVRLVRQSEVGSQLEMGPVSRVGVSPCTRCADSYRDGVAVDAQCSIGSRGEATSQAPAGSARPGAPRRCGTCRTPRRRRGRARCFDVDARGRPHLPIGSRVRPAPPIRQRGGIGHLRCRAGRGARRRARPVERIERARGLIRPSWRQVSVPVEPRRTGRARSVASSRAFESFFVAPHRQLHS